MKIIYSHMELYLPPEGGKYWQRRLRIMHKRCPCRCVPGEVVQGHRGIAGLHWAPKHPLLFQRLFLHVVG